MSNLNKIGNIALMIVLALGLVAVGLGTLFMVVALGENPYRPLTLEASHFSDLAIFVILSAFIFRPGGQEHTPRFNRKISPNQVSSKQIPDIEVFA